MFAALQLYNLQMLQAAAGLQLDQKQQKSHQGKERELQQQQPPRCRKTPRGGINRSQAAMDSLGLLLLGLYAPREAPATEQPPPTVAAVQAAALTPAMDKQSAMWLVLAASRRRPC